MNARERDELIEEYTEELIKDGVQENKLSLRNGFDVIFRDRISSKTRAKQRGIPN